MSKSVRLVIHGRVQGVFYRVWTREQALRHGLEGWVRNLSDGSVEALLCGRIESVEAMIADCREGPPAARVTGIDIAPAEPPEPSRGFAILD